MIITMMWFGTFMVLTFLPKFSPYSATQLEGITEQSPMALISTVVIVQGLLSIFIFLIPALLFSYLAHPKPAEYLGLRTPGKNIQLLLVILVMLGAMPLLQMIEGFVSHINFGAKVKAEQAASDSMYSAFLHLPTFASFIRTFIVIAIIPAVGEEMFFRGVLMRFVKKKSRNMVVPVLFTAMVFSYSHTNVYGYLSIFLAGVLLAVIYNITGSLWCSIVAHMFFNGSQVILSYLGNNNAAVKAFLSNESVPVYYIICGALVFGISFYLLLKNKTPLPANWADDFTAEELSRNPT